MRARDSAKFKRTEDLLRIERDLGIALSLASDLNEAFDRLLQAAFRIEAIDCGGVYTVNPVTGAADLIAHGGLPDWFISAASHYDGHSPQARSLAAGKPMYALLPGQPPDTVKLCKRAGIRALAVIPVYLVETLVTGDLQGTVKWKNATGAAVEITFAHGK